MSHLEGTLATQLAYAGLGGFKAQFCAIQGRRFAWDFCFEDARLLIEVQGGTFAKGRTGHSTGMGIHRDCEKANLATLAGWRVLSVDEKHIRSGQALRWIQEALGRAA